MECIILVRMNNGAVVAIEDEDNIKVFTDLNEATELAEKHTLCQNMPYQIVELDEL